MTRGQKLLSDLDAIAILVEQLPDGVTCTLEWPEAPVDLLTALCCQQGADTRDLVLVGGRRMQEVEWRTGAIVVRAQRVYEHPWERGKVSLTLVRP